MKQFPSSSFLIKRQRIWGKNLVPVDHDDSFSEHDVLWGRTKAAHAHAGNVAFRNMVRQFRFEYQNTAIRDSKAKVVNHIMESIARKGGRFLRSDDEGTNWREVKTAQVYEKVSHALRSARPIKKTAEERLRLVTADMVIQPPAQINDDTYSELLCRQVKLLEDLKSCHKQYIQNQRQMHCPEDMLQSEMDFFAL